MLAAPIETNQVFVKVGEAGLAQLRAAAEADVSHVRSRLYLAAEMMRMYIRYAEMKRWKVEMTDANYSSVNGIKDATLQIEGNIGTMLPWLPSTSRYSNAKPPSRMSSTAPRSASRARSGARPARCCA